MVRIKAIQINEETGRDCLAIALGCIAGCVWWILHRKYFVEVYWNLVPVARAKGFVPQGFDGLFAALNLATAVGQSFSVGFIAGALAPRRPYRLAFAAMILTFICKFPCNALVYELSHSHYGHRRPDETWWITCLFLLIYGAGPLCSAFLAQAFKPRKIFESDEDRTIYSADKTFARSLVSTLGFGLVLSLLWKTVFVLVLFSLGLLCLVIPPLQSATIGFCVARAVPLHKEKYAIGVALLMLAFDALLWGAGTRSAWALFFDLDFWAIVIFCAAAALFGANLAK